MLNSLNKTKFKVIETNEVKKHAFDNFNKIEYNLGYKLDNRIISVYDKIIPLTNSYELYSYQYKNLSIYIYVDKLDANRINKNKDIYNEQNEMFISIVLYVYKVYCLYSGRKPKIKFFFIQSYEKKKFDTDNIIDAHEINSGVTSISYSYDKYSNKDINVIVYREEEFLRVTVHELIHAFEFEKTFNEFGLCNNFNYSFEAYTEFWSELITNWILAFKIISVKDEYKLKLFEDLMYEDLKWTTQIIVYIIKKYGMPDLKQCDMIKQKTSFYHYFFVKYAMLISYKKLIYIYSNSKCKTNCIEPSTLKDSDRIWELDYSKLSIDKKTNANKIINHNLDYKKIIEAKHVDNSLYEMHMSSRMTSFNKIDLIDYYIKNYNAF